MEQNQQQIHPMAQGIINWVNESITLEEAKARTTLIASVVDDLMAGLHKFEQQATATDETGAPVEVEEVTAE